jgi:hypothetical protein
LPRTARNSRLRPKGSAVNTPAWTSAASGRMRSYMFARGDLASVPCTSRLSTGRRQSGPLRCSSLYPAGTKKPSGHPPDSSTWTALIIISPINTATQGEFLTAILCPTAKSPIYRTFHQEQQCGIRRAFFRSHPPPT